MRCFNMAYEMRKHVQNVTYGPENKKVNVKIGIHNGTVTTGIIGYHKP